MDENLDSKFATFPLVNRAELQRGRYGSLCKHRNWIQTHCCSRGHFLSFLGRLKESDLDKWRRRADRIFYTGHSETGIMS